MRETEKERVPYAISRNMYNISEMDHYLYLCVTYFTLSLCKLETDQAVSVNFERHYEH
jgi:hypothetical protein